MPNINITEVDLTTSGGRNTNFNVVYVPGFMSDQSDAWPKKKDGTPDFSKAASKNSPILCTSVVEFEKYFGLKPATFSSTGYGESRDVDKSYVYAKELLKLGLPVLYESVNGNAGSTIGTPSKSAIMDAINTGMLDKLIDKSEYQFKYLTSGGYPLFSDTSTDSQTDNTDEDTTTISVNVLNGFTTESDTPEIYKLVCDSSNTWRQFKQDVDENNKTIYEDSNVSYKGVRVEGTDGYVYVLTEDIYDATNSTLVQNILVSLNAQDKSGTIKKDYDYNFNAGDSIVITVKKDDGATGTFESISTKPGASTYSKMTSVAVSRGDCIAIIDAEKDMEPSDLYDSVKTTLANLDGADQCVMFTPWVNVHCPTYIPVNKEDNIIFSLPPSFAYLSALAKSIRTNASWLAVAGASRGQVPNLDGDNPLDTEEVLTNSIAESFQNRDGISINAITNIKPFGYRIWGNRTLKNNSVEGDLTATSFLNIRNMICDVKKVVYEACRKYTFEQNNDVLWLNFKSYVEPTLNQMKTGAGLSGYKIIKKTDTDEKAKLEAVIKLYPLYAVEDFEITVQMLDNEITVS